MRTQAQKLGYMEGWISVVLNTALFAVKYWVGVLAGSVAMIADAWHTLSDTLTSAVLILGFWISARRPDRQHPFGHGRAEIIGALVIGTLLAVVGVSFFKESVLRLIHHTPAHFSVMAMLVFGLSGFLKEALAQFSLWAGRKTGSASLRADGWHHRSDAIASALIVLGALTGARWWWMDGAMGMLVSLLILHATYDIFMEASSKLLGEAPEPNLEEKIKAVIKAAAPTVQIPHHFHLHRYGEHIELTFHVRMPPEVNLAFAHSVANAIETAIRAELSMESTIHIEPFL